MNLFLCLFSVLCETNSVQFYRTVLWAHTELGLLSEVFTGNPCKVLQAILWNTLPVMQWLFYLNLLPQFNFLLKLQLCYLELCSFSINLWDITHSPQTHSCASDQKTKTKTSMWFCVQVLHDRLPSTRLWVCSGTHVSWVRGNVFWTPQLFSTSMLTKTHTHTHKYTPFWRWNPPVINTAIAFV